MQRAWKFGGVTLGAGGLLGLAVVGFLWSTKPDATPVNSKGGVLSLSDDPTPSTETGQSSDLSVAPSSGDGQGTVLGSSGSTGSSRGSGSSNSAGSSGNASSGDSSAQWPGPESFKEYEKVYADPDKGGAYEMRLGTGAAVAAGNTVSVNYRGWLTNGTQFDESYNRGKPFTFKQGTGSVISGWEQGVLGMKVGGKRRLVLPANLGYGARAQQGIPANSMLIFDVELVAVQE